MAAYKQLKIEYSAAANASTTAVPITSVPTRCAKIMIRLRSLGAATYVAIGRSDSQEFRLTAASDYWETPTMPTRCDYIDAHNIYVVTDNNAAKVEYILWKWYDEEP
jgi:hypothetical protein